MEPPNTYKKELKNAYEKKLKNSETRNLWKPVFLLKSCEPLYTCTPAPFYKKTNGLLHYDITLGSKEYSKWENVHESLLHPVIYRANSDICKLAILSHLEPGLMAPHLWLAVRGSCLHSRRLLSVHIPTLEVLTRHWGHVSWAAKFLEVSILLKLRTNSRTISWTQPPSANISPEGFIWVRKISIHTSHKL
jgi:hypothetical protein